jgi:hypothetical protein
MPQQSSYSLCTLHSVTMLPVLLACTNISLSMLQVLHGAYNKNQNSSVSTVTSLWAGQSGVRVPTWARDFSLLHKAQAGCGAQPIAYSTNTRSSFPGGKAAWTWKTTCLHLGPRLRMSTTNLYSLYTPPWHGQLYLSKAHLRNQREKNQ